MPIPATGTTLPGFEPGWRDTGSDNAHRRAGNRAWMRPGRQAADGGEQLMKTYLWSDGAGPRRQFEPDGGGSLNAISRPARFYSSTRSNTTTLRSLSALMIFLFGGLTPERTMLIDDGATPFSFASRSVYFRTKQANYVLLI
jgi:hypothetical protein